MPIRCARSRPLRIKRRMVSGFRPVRRAASGTVINLRRYYYIAGRPDSGHHAFGGQNSGWSFSYTVMR
jgi:hypothetical protein